MLDEKVAFDGPPAAREEKSAAEGRTADGKAAAESSAENAGSPALPARLTATDGRLEVAAETVIELSAATVRREPRLPQNVPTVVDTDSERIAFSLWREGRADEAIAFLEREILIEKDRAWKTGAADERREPRFGKPVPDVIIVPPVAASGKPTKKRRKGGPIAVSEPAFSDASAPMIDISADAAARDDAALAARELEKPDRIGRGPAWIALFGLVVVAVATGAYLWDDRHPHGTVGIDRASVDVVSPAETGSVEPAAETGAASEAATAGPADPAPAASAAPKQSAIPAALPTPEADRAPGDRTVETATAASPAVTDAAAIDEPPPEGLDDTAEATDPAVPPATARLPRQRPEPPTSVAAAPAKPVARTPARSVAPAAAPAPVVTADAGNAAMSDDLPLPFYGPDGLPHRETLTREEYQALLDRRAAAEDYVVRQNDAYAMTPWERRRRAIPWLGGE